MKLHQYSLYTRQYQGFTLLEVLLVLVLMGLAVSIVLPNLKPDDSDSVIKTEARRFAALVQVAHETALISGKDLGIKVTDHRYEFMVWQKGHWEQLTRDRLLVPVTLKKALKLSIRPGESVWKEALEQESKNNGILLSEKTDSKKKEPNLFIWSSGELSPAEVTFAADKKNGHQQRIILHETGQIELKDALAEAYL
ncbi:type II secretion system minor pseudopilin GspH [Endozoicomonas sp. Mp262]|uniref:type II secretion system minor pseudopilin GspH n=1 Tax=Endozoicomonas sp. Mp262 TaxID=2919499 RepID=UPI0021D9ACC7